MHVSRSGGRNYVFPLVRRAPPGHNPEMQNREKPSVPRIVKEGAAIVISILLAFAIDAWWDERALRTEEQQVLRGLRAEFISVRDVLSDHKDVHGENLRALEEFLLAAEGDNVAAARPIVDVAMLELLSPMTTDLGVGILDALLSSGRIEILSNRSLRAKLAGWAGVIEEVWDDQDLAAKTTYEIHLPYFIAAGIPAGEAMHQWYDDWPLPRRSLSDDPDMVARLLHDPKLRQMVALRFGYKKHLVIEFDIALAAVNAILADIDSSIH